MRPQLNEKFRKVIRVANAAWASTQLSSSQRYSLHGWNEVEGMYYVYDDVSKSFVGLTDLYERLDPRRRKAVWI